MHYLSLALYAEGPTDTRFLSPLLLRLCRDLCLRHQRQLVDVAEDVMALADATGVKDAPRAERIAAAGRAAVGAWNILFVHSDGEGDPARVLRERVQPGLSALRAEALPRTECVPVVPIRETEAWTLVDGEALRQVFGTTLSDADMALPAAGRAVEGITDPKAVLDAAFQATQPNGRRARAGAAAMLHLLGERVSLQRLREIPSFRTLESDLLDALHRLRIC